MPVRRFAKGTLTTALVLCVTAVALLAVAVVSQPRLRSLFAGDSNHIAVEVTRSNGTSGSELKVQLEGCPDGKQHIQQTTGAQSVLRVTC